MRSNIYAILVGIHVDNGTLHCHFFLKVNEIRNPSNIQRNPSCILSEKMRGRSRNNSVGGVGGKKIYGNCALLEATGTVTSTWQGRTELESLLYEYVQPTSLVLYSYRKVGSVFTSSLVLASRQARCRGQYLEVSKKQVDNKRSRDASLQES